MHASQLHRHRVWLLAIALVTALPACNRAPAPAPVAPAPQPAATTPAPVAEKPSRIAQLNDFLHKRYGEQAALAKPWPGQWEDPEQAGMRTVSYRVCAEQPVLVGRDWHQLLAICGTLDKAGHPEPGLIDFFVLREADQGFVPVIERIAGAFGSSGNPGTVSVLRLGRDLYGFRVEHSWYGQGYALVSQDLLIPGKDSQGKDQLIEAGSLRSHIDNEGAAHCEGDETADCAGTAFDVDFDLVPDATDPAAERWPLEVREHGQACGKPVAEAHRFTLDPASYRFDFPKSLQREGCQ